MSQQYRYPNSAVVSVNIASEGNIDQPAPGELLQVGGRDPSDDLVPLRFNASGELLVDITGSLANPLPVTDAAAEASLASIDSKTPALGQALMAASQPVVIASNQSTLPVSAASLPLPAGAATEAKQDAQIVLETAISGKLPATLGQKAMAASLAVAISSDQSVIPVSAAALPLPSGAATETKQDAQIVQETAIAVSVAAINTKTPALASGRVPVDVQASVLPTGAATETTLAAINTKTPSLGQAAMAASVPVVLASNQSAIPVAAAGGRARANTPTYKDYSSGNVTTGAYVQLIASTTSATSLLDIFDSSGQAMIIAVGAAASEVDQFYVFPGGNGQVQLAIPAGSRVSVKALTATASSGYLLLNLYT